MHRASVVLLVLALACEEERGSPDSGLVFRQDSGVASDGGARPDAGTPQVIQVQAVFDGDTIRVGASFSLFTPDNKPLADETIRFLGIDAPEIAHPPAPADCWGPEAHDYARNLLQGRTITLEFDVSPTCPMPVPPERAEACHLRDDFGRLLAYVVLNDGRVANEIFVREGMARSFRRFPHRETAKYNMLEGEAQAARRGLWTCP